MQQVEMQSESKKARSPHNSLMPSMNPGIGSSTHSTGKSPGRYPAEVKHRRELWRLGEDPHTAHRGSFDAPLPTSRTATLGPFTQSHDLKPRRQLETSSEEMYSSWETTYQETIEDVCVPYEEMQALPVYNDPPLSPLSPAESQFSFTNKPQLSALSRKRQGIDSHDSSSLNDSLEELRRLVKEESIDVDMALKIHSMNFKNNSHLRNMQLVSEVIDEMEETEDTEEIQPEVAAAIMHTEEQGLPMGCSPMHLYNYLFPEEEEKKSMMSIGAAGPLPLEDVIIPLSLPTQQHHALYAEDAAVLASAVKNIPEHPSGSIFTDTLEKNGQLRRKLANAGTEPKNLEEWVGVAPSSAVSATAPSSSSSSSHIPGAVPDRMECVIEVQPPSHFSQIQLRGSCLPSWFPGFYQVFPNSADLISLSPSPSAVMFEAWKLLQPKTFHPKSQVITNM